MFESPLANLMAGMLVALAAGLLIGIEREQSARRNDEHSFGGVRTFPLIALGGALAGLLTSSAGALALVGALAVLGALLAMAHQERARERRSGFTTELAALVTFLLGAASTLEDLAVDGALRFLFVLAVAGITMALLSIKEPLHQAVSHLTPDDLFATAKFVTLALVVLPLLPDVAYGPLAVWNPFEIGVMVVLIAAIGFIGYFATRFIGAERALIVTGIVGGLASSTAVTVSLSPRVREAPQVVTATTAALLAASSTMFVRVLVAVGAVDRPLLPSLALPVGTMAAVGFALAVWLYLRSTRGRDGQSSIHLQNPFALSSALKFGALFAVVLLCAKAGQSYFGARGLFLSSVVAGTTDVDAITLSVAKLHGQGLAAHTAVTAITLATLTNTFVKVGIAAWLGGAALGRRFLLAQLAVVGSGLAMLLV